MATSTTSRPTDRDSESHGCRGDRAGGRVMGPPPTKPHHSVYKVTDHWYIACRSEVLKRKPKAMTILGIPMVLFRAEDGTVSALLDRCAHRNVPLSPGRVVGQNLECSYHGWQFDGAGGCAKVPGLCNPLSAASNSQSRARRVPAFAATEQDGFIWVYPTADTAPVRKPFAFPRLDPTEYTLVRRSVDADGSLFSTVENALDVPHTAFTHGGLFRTTKVRNPVTAILRRYADRAEVEYLGEPRPEGVVARFLAPGGGVVQHFDRFFLPGVAQVEYRIGDDIHFIVTAACTPIEDYRTALHAVVQFNLRLPGWLVKPLLEPFARVIFGQDKTVLKRQTRLIERFGGEQFESTELDMLGPQIQRLLKAAERGEAPVERDGGAPELEKTIRFMA